MQISKFSIGLGKALIRRNTTVADLDKNVNIYFPLNRDQPKVSCDTMYFNTNEFEIRPIL